MLSSTPSTFVTPRSATLSKPNTAVSLRLARAADLIALSDLNRQGFANAHRKAFYTSDLQAYLADTFNRHQMTADFADKSSLTIVAETKAGIVGNVRLKRAPMVQQPTSLKAVELSRLYLRPFAVGQGVGSALMRGALRTAVRLGYHTCWLAVWQQNEHAIRFYQRWGFEIVGKMALEVGQSAPQGWVMSLTLRR